MSHHFSHSKVIQEKTKDYNCNFSKETYKCRRFHWVVKQLLSHRIIVDRMENSVNGRRIRYNLR